MKRIFQRVQNVIASVSGNDDAREAVNSCKKQLDMQISANQVLESEKKSLQERIDAILAFSESASKDPEKPHLVLVSMMDERVDTTESLSEKLNYSKSTLTRFLNGRMNMTANLAVRLERAGYATAKYWMDLQTVVSIADAHAFIDQDCAND